MENNDYTISPKKLIYRNIKYFEDILEGISVSLAMCDKNNNIVFLNKFGYEYLKLKPEDILKKKCYDIFGSNSKCKDCPIGKSLVDILPTKKEILIDCLENNAEIGCSPILNSFGCAQAAVILIKELSNEAGKNYRKIANLSNDAMVIISDEAIVLANTKALNVFDNPIGTRMEEFIPREYLKTYLANIDYVMKNNLNRYIFDCKVNYKDGITADVEISSNSFSYRNRPAMLISIRDVSIKRKELNAAADYQVKAFERDFPIEDKLYMATMYMPAKVVSGDFYYLSKTGENSVVGILGDVSGKSFKAAMDISALNIIYHEALLISETPIDIIKIMNKKVISYFHERYVAALCFRFDFDTRKLSVVAAGINQFVLKDNDGKFVVKCVEGQYLGMFDDIDVEECVLEFDKGGWVCFYTDGLDFMFHEDEIYNSLKNVNSISEFKNLAEERTREKQAVVNGKFDDATMLLFEMR